MITLILNLIFVLLFDLRECQKLYTIILCVLCLIYLLKLLTGTYIHYMSPPVNITPKNITYESFLEGQLNDEIIKDTETENTPKGEKNLQSDTKEYSPPISMQIKQKEGKNIIALMLKNMQETTEYFSISKKQERRSFLLSIIFCISGLVAILGAITIFYFTDKLGAGVVTIIGGVVSEFIAATAFWIHSKSTQQFNYFYERLHENEKFLSAVNIVESISEEKRDEIYIEIIRKQLESAVQSDNKQGVEQRPPA